MVDHNSSYNAVSLFSSSFRELSTSLLASVSIFPSLDEPSTFEVGWLSSVEGSTGDADSELSGSLVLLFAVTSLRGFPIFGCGLGILLTLATYMDCNTLKNCRRTPRRCFYEFGVCRISGRTSWQYLLLKFRKLLIHFIWCKHRVAESRSPNNKMKLGIRNAAPEFDEQLIKSNTKDLNTNY